MAIMDQARREGKASKKNDAKKGGVMGDDSAIRNLDFHRKTIEQLEKEFGTNTLSGLTND